MYLGDEKTNIQDRLFHTHKWPRKENCHGHLNSRCLKTATDWYKNGAKYTNSETKKDNQNREVPPQY